MVGAYTFWDAIWTMIIFFAWIMFITWVILLMIDNFRRKDHTPSRDRATPATTATSLGPTTSPPRQPKSWPG